MNKLLPFFAIGALIAFCLLFVLPVETALYAKIGGAVLALLATIGAFLSPSQPKAPKPVEEASKPAPSIETKGNAEAEVITLLARMQEKGRLVDFLMDDISAHDDATIGAAARVVYQGCKEVLDEHFKVEAIESGNEGGKVTIEDGYDAGLYRLTGNLSGKAPFSGTLVHKGWKVTSANLPKIISNDSDDLPALAPAQVEV